MIKSSFLALPAVLLGLTVSAQASIIPIGSSYTLIATNAPGTYTANTTFGGSVSVDGGAATLTMSQVATGANGEWDIWKLTTTSGGPIASNTGANWDITQDYVLSQNVKFDAVVDQWSVNGTPVTPTGSIGGICCAVSNNPATGGGAFYKSGFSGPISAGTVTNWNQIFVNPYSFVSSGGIDASTANGFTWALHFTLQSPVPEPGDLAILLVALAGLGAVKAGRSRRNHRGAS